MSRKAKFHYNFLSQTQTRKPLEYNGCGFLTRIFVVKNELYYIALYCAILK